MYTDSFPAVKDWFTPLNNRAGIVWSLTLERRAGFQNLYFPRTDSCFGVTVIGGSEILNSSKSFLQTKLKAPLDSGCPYSVGMYYLFVFASYTGDPYFDTAWTASNRLGMHLSELRIQDLGDTSVSGLPQLSAFDSQNISPQVEIPIFGGFNRDTTQYTLLVIDTVQPMATERRIFNDQ